MRMTEEEYCAAMKRETKAPVAMVVAPVKAAKPNKYDSILAIDPGTEISGWCELFRDEDGIHIAASGVMPNADMLLAIDGYDASGGWLLAVEMIASYGMPVGREVFETCVFIGRLIERWKSSHRLIYRRDVKLHLCGSARAKDGNIRQALIDKIGPAGVKKAPGPTYGVKSHAWAALAVGITAMETRDILETGK